VTVDIDRSQNRYARLAGFMFLFVDVAYAVGLSIISRFVVPGNFAETTHKIMASELFYRFGLSSLLVAGLCTVLLAMGLYGAVKPVDNNLALLALVFRLIEAAVFGVMGILNFVSLELHIGPDSMNAFDAKQLSVLAHLSSVAGTAGFNIAALFFSMGSILFFYLLVRSKYIPSVLANLGFYGSFLVPIICFGSLLLPQYSRTLFFGWAPIGLAEISVGLWLLIKGVNTQRWKEQAGAAGIRA
jgi:hypothetical protein